MSNQTNALERIDAKKTSTKNEDAYEGADVTRDEVRGIYFVDYTEDQDGKLRWIREPYVPTANLFHFFLKWDKKTHKSIRVTPLEDLIEPINKELQTESEFRYCKGNDAKFEPWGQVSERMFDSRYSITKMKLELWREMWLDRVRTR